MTDLAVWLPITGSRPRRLGRARDAGRLIAVPALALGAGAAVCRAPALSALGAIGITLVTIVAVRPAVGVYLLVVLTPLTAGIDRGTVIPVLRPSEAVILVVAAGLFVRWAVSIRSLARLVPRWDAVSATVLGMAVTSSVLPLLLMRLRGETISADDLFYALVVWKFYVVFVAVRAARLGEREIWRCIALSIATATLISVIAVLQALGWRPVIDALAPFYTTNANVGALSNSRGSSTLALPIAVADLASFNLCLVVGALRFGRFRRAPLLAAGLVLLLGVVSAAEFSGFIGLIVGVIALCIGLRSARLLRYVVPAFALSAVALWPVVAVRLAGFRSSSGLPTSWTGRLVNLRENFWPVLFDGHRFILGVRPAARVADPHKANGFVWIESGYTWLLWAGGLPLLFSFLAFVVVVWRRALRVTRTGGDAQRVTALACCAAVAIIAVLMTFDPHLTYRGSGDELFVLVALTLPAAAL